MMKNQLHKAIDMLVNATSKVNDQYFQVPIAGKEDPLYRERIYCYELYHLMKQEWPEDFCYSLMGEVDKAGHPYYRNNRLDNAKPDFLFHKPGLMSDNLLVVEVKPTNAEICDIQHDLDKLSAFVQLANYEKAVYLFYGSGTQKDLIQKIQKAKEKVANFEYKKIIFYHHTQPMQAAECIDKWINIVQ